jgi:hypothetical protein
MTDKLVLVSSYPKSGNTWVRMVLEQLRREPDWKFSINEMPTGYYGHAHRLLFDALSPVNASDLFTEELHAMLPHVYRSLANSTDTVKVLKVHDACRRVGSGEWLYPEDAVDSVIFLVRHPFDVAVSLAPHLDITIPEAVDFMATGKVSGNAPAGLDLPLPENLASWSENIVSWLDHSPHKVTLTRYEDLHAAPLTHFTRIAKAAGFDPKEEDIARFLEATRFEKLREEEKQSGFRERPKTSTTFFREGKPRSWEGKLDDALRQKLVQDHGAVMARLGYLADGGIVPIPGDNAH